MLVHVAIDLSLNRLFTYSVPEALLARVCVGQRVRVPFGPRESTGYILATDVALPQAVDGKKPIAVKAIAAIEDDIPIFSAPMVKLVRWIADYTFAPLEAALRCALPAAVRARNARAKEMLFVDPVAKPPVVSLTARQQTLAENILRVGGGWMNRLMREFSCSAPTLRALADKGVVVISQRQMRRDPLANRTVLPSRPLTLGAAQAKALATICTQLDCTSATPPVVLFGVTGSGKTEVYLQAIAHVLEQGRGAIVLVPEIALTPQTVQRFAARFGAQIAVLHSALSDGERYDEWHRIRTGEARVVVGPRSAVFAPVARLGLIVVDEEHEPSYKQDEAPRYNARDVAVMRGAFESCVVVLGSATPSMETWHNVQTGKYICAAIPERVAGRPMPAVRVVDMADERARSGKAAIFSLPLLDALKERLERGEQSILFLNRRGYARSLTCPACGRVEECPDCSVAYTYHQIDTCLRCHVCGGWKHVPTTCPACGALDFSYAGIGTQRVEAALKRCFPQARILRMDADVTARKHSHDEILTVFKSGKADILLGTQMIAKGLDFPNVTLVGVLMADSSLNMPDFRAAERTYQLLAQVSGRAGRAELPGEVFIQTYSPSHPAVRAAAGSEGFTAFAKQELVEREEGFYPPFSRLACLTFQGADESSVSRIAVAWQRNLVSYATACAAKRSDARVMVSEAMPAVLAKARGLFRYQVLVRAATPRILSAALTWVRKVSMAPTDVKVVIDVDALNMM